MSQAVMTTLETINAMDDRSYAEITFLLSLGKGTFHDGGVFTNADFDELMDAVLGTEPGVN